jgi:hypothetical protein
MPVTPAEATVVLFLTDLESFGLGRGAWLRAEMGLGFVLTAEPGLLLLPGVRVVE